jgi:hypothetical protein
MTPWRAGAVVVAGWALLLAVFVLVNAGYGQGAWVLVMYSCAVVLAALFGLALFLWTRRRQGSPRSWHVPRHVTSAPLLAIAAALIVVGVAFTWTGFLPAFWLLVLAARRTVRERR